MASWKRYEELRPDQLEELVADAPIAYWPLGLLEHHGVEWALLDGRQLRVFQDTVRILSRTSDSVSLRIECCRLRERRGIRRGAALRGPDQPLCVLEVPLRPACTRAPTRPQ